MQVFIVTVQGHYIDVFATIEEAEVKKLSLYMGGSDGISISTKTI